MQTLDGSAGAGGRRGGDAADYASGPPQVRLQFQQPCREKSVIMNANDFVLGVECALPPGFVPYDESGASSEPGMPSGDTRLILVINRKSTEAACV